MKVFKKSKKASNWDLDKTFEFGFLQKSEIQNQTNSILIGLFSITSMSILVNDMMKHTFFRKIMHILPLDNWG